MLFSLATVYSEVKRFTSQFLFVWIFIHSVDTAVRSPVPLYLIVSRPSTVPRVTNSLRASRRLRYLVVDEPDMGTRKTWSAKLSIWQIIRCASGEKRVLYVSIASSLTNNRVKLDDNNFHSVLPLYGSISMVVFLGWSYLLRTTRYVYSRYVTLRRATVSMAMFKTSDVCWSLWTSCKQNLRADVTDSDPSTNCTYWTWCWIDRILRSAEYQPVK